MTAFSQPPDDTGEPQHGWRMSLAFWMCLLLAAAVYASVVLAPKLLEHVVLRGEYARNQNELVSLERRVKYLERVRDALENDPEFAAELARIDFDVSRPGDERIPVEPLLTLDAPSIVRQASRPQKDAAGTAAAQSSLSPSSGTPRVLPWYSPLLEALATNRTVRISCLVFAAIVTLGAFTLLHESEPQAARGRFSPAALAGPLSRLTKRYRRRADGDEG